MDRAECSGNLLQYAVNYFALLKHAEVSPVSFDIPQVVQSAKAKNTNQEVLDLDI